MTLIILHGWKSSKEKWEKVKKILEKRGIEVIVPDLPGFKKENKIERPWNLQDYLNWFKNFSKNFEKFFLLGHSFGGRIAIKFAANENERLMGLILVSAAGIPVKNFLNFSLKKISKLFKKNSFIKSFFQKLFIFLKKDLRGLDENMVQTFKLIVEEDLSKFLEKIKVKTLILWGKKDKILPLRHALLMKSKIPFSKLEILENLGHSPHLENPEVLAEKIYEFLKE